MGFNKRKMEAERKALAEAEAAARRATALAPVGPLPSLPHDERDRPADPRPPPRRRGQQPDPIVVMPLMSAECSVRGAGATLAYQHCRRHARREPAPGPG